MPAEPTAEPAGSRPPPYPTRFGWAMRLFLGLLVFDLVFRSFSIFIPWTEWARGVGHRGPAAPPADAGRDRGDAREGRPGRTRPRRRRPVAGRRFDVGLLPALAGAVGPPEDPHLGRRRQVGRRLGHEPARGRGERPRLQRGVADVLAERRPPQARRPRPADLRRRQRADRPQPRRPGGPAPLLALVQGEGPRPRVEAPRGAAAWPTTTGATATCSATATRRTTPARRWPGSACSWCATTCPRRGRTLASGSPARPARPPTRSCRTSTRSTPRPTRASASDSNP